MVGCNIADLVLLLLSPTQRERLEKLEVAGALVSLAFFEGKYFRTCFDKTFPLVCAPYKICNKESSKNLFALQRKGVVPLELLPRKKYGDSIPKRK